PTVESISAIAMQFALIGLPWWWFAFRLTYYTFTPDLERDLARYGKTREVMERIDAELRTSSDVNVRGRFDQQVLGKDDFIALTPRWLVQVRPHRAAVMLVEEIVWIYKRVVPRRVWLRSTSYRIQLGCRLRDGTALQIEAREHEVDELAEELLDRRPGL